jgi:hypothetical protein
MRSIRLLPIILPMATLLGGCPGDLSDPAVVTKIVCPAIQQYDAATQDAALAEYKALPAGSAIKRMVGDYLNLRDQVRACRKQAVG